MMERKPLAAIWIVIGMMLVVAKAGGGLKGSSGPTDNHTAAATVGMGVNPMQCDLTEYKAVPGLKAEMIGDVLRISWQGAGGQEARASFGLVEAAPIIREIAIRRKQAGQWSVLGRDLTPEFYVTTGRRRISEQQLAPLRTLSLDR